MKGKYLIFMLTILILFSVNFACASDFDNETLMLHESSLELAVEETSDIVLTEESPGSFADLKNSIDADSDLTLNKSYKFNSDVDNGPISISQKSLTIDGKGNTIDADNSSSVFSISSSDVTFKNIIFQNAYNSGNGGAILVFSSKITLQNCTFINTRSAGSGGAVSMTGGEASITDSHFTNTQSKKGGALYFYTKMNVTITDCEFSGTKATGSGGAIYTSQIDALEVSNSVFSKTNATSGGAIYETNSNRAHIDGCNFSQNSAISGGAFMAYSGTNITIENCIFDSNSANAGGAAYLRTKYGVIRSSSFKSNRADIPYNTGEYGAGGAIDWRTYAAVKAVGHIYDCSFEDNVAVQYGGAINWALAGKSSIMNCNFTRNSAGHDGGAVMFATNLGGSVIANATFTQNSARNGGAVYFVNYDGTLTESRFLNNSATEKGGSLYIMGFGVKVSKCEFENSSAQKGGSLYLEQRASKKYGLNMSESTFKNTRAADGGAIYNYEADATYSNCNITDSSATNDGGAIYNYNARGVIFEDVTVTDSSAARYGGVAYSQNSNVAFKDMHVEGSNAPYGGAFANYKGNYGFANVSLNDVNGAAYGGAIYNLYADMNVSDMDFKNLYATYYGGAIYSNQGKIAIRNVTFENIKSNYSGGALYLNLATAIIEQSRFMNLSTKYYGGAVYAEGGLVKINGSQLSDNVAGYYGGAIYQKSYQELYVSNSTFVGNNATYGSAIFKRDSSKTTTENSVFENNQAGSYSILITRHGRSFQAVFRGLDNVINAIWNNDGADSVVIDGIACENGATPDKVYKDAREFDQTIIVDIYDEHDNLLSSREMKTGLYGEVNVTVENGAKVVFTHPEDRIYKYISNYAYVPQFEISKTSLAPEIRLKEQAIFEITVKNTGFLNLTDMVLREASFEGLILDSFDGDGFRYNGDNTWILANLAINETKTLKVTFNTTEFGIFENVAVCEFEGIEKSDRDTVKVYTDLFKAGKFTLIPVVQLGNQTIFEIVVHNVGEDDLHNVYVIEESFEGLIFDHVHEDTLWDYELIDGKHTWKLKDSLYAHEYAGIFIVFNTTEIGNFTNFATVGYNGIEQIVNSTVEVVNVVIAPEEIIADMNITIVTVHPVVQLGDKTVFEIVVHNTGNVMLTNVTVEEFDHEGLIFDGFIDASNLWDFKPTTISKATKKDVLAAARVNNDNSWTINMPLYVNEYLGFFVVFNSTATGTFTNTVFGNSDQTGDKFAASDVDVIHATEEKNETDNGGNETAEDTDNAGETEKESSDDGTDHDTGKTESEEAETPEESSEIGTPAYEEPAPEKSTGKTSYPKGMEKHATGNPFMALLAVLLCIVLVRRRK